MSKLTLRKTTSVILLVFSLMFVNHVEMGNAQQLFDHASDKENEYFQQMTGMMPSIEKSIECMAMNIYHEARNEIEAGRRAVGFVTMNRVKSDLFPNSVCEVVYQARLSRWHLENSGKSVPLRNQCQFSWYCDGKSDKIYEPAKYEDARQLAYQIIMGYNDMVDITDGALWYHADYVNPYWAKDYKRVGKIDTHIFYKERS
jgi:spore germination cell wall hydrolase CwlJ-like protein